MVLNAARRRIFTLGTRPRWPFTTRRRSLNSVVIKSVDKVRVRQAMDDLAEKLFSKHGDIEEIVVFGSFETGDFIPGSDLDVLLALRESDKPVRDRVGDFLPQSFPVPLDLFPFTRAEMCELAPSPVLDAVSRSTWRYRKRASSAN